MYDTTTVIMWNLKILTISYEMQDTTIWYISDNYTTYNLFLPDNYKNKS